MLAANQRIWGFETNFGGLADLAVVKANQLMPKPTHLTWEEAAVNALCNSTSYRMLVGRNGARMKQGDVVLVWGATGGIGGYAIQYVLNGGGTPVGVVSSPEKVELLHELGVEAVIDRKAEGYRFWSDAATQDEAEWRRFGKRVRELVGDDPDIVFEHPGRQTMGASIFVVQARRHGRHVRGDVGVHDRVRQPPLLDEAEAADRQPLRQLRRGVGGEPARSTRAASSRCCRPCSRSTEVGAAARSIHRNEHEGKIGVLCLAAGRASASTTPRSGSGSARTGSRCSAATAR